MLKKTDNTLAKLKQKFKLTIFFWSKMYYVFLLLIKKSTCGFSKKKSKIDFSLKKK